MVRQALLEDAYFHQLRDHRIGETDGFDPKTAADLGFDSPERVAELIGKLGGGPETRSPKTKRVADAIGEITCGDCGRVIPCPHAGNGRTYGN